MLLKQPSETSLFSDKKFVEAQIHDLLINEDPFGASYFCAIIQSYCVIKFACNYDEARD